MCNVIRYASLTLLTLSQAGCGLYVPEVAEVWDQYDLKATEHMEKQIRLAVYCELRAAVRETRAENASRYQYYYKGKLVTSPEDQPLPDDWGAEVTLTFTVDESTKLAPGVSFKTPMHDANVHFKGESITSDPILSTLTFAPIKVAQNYAFGLGGVLSSDANRIDIFDTYYSMWELGTYNTVEHVCAIPPGQDVMGPESHSSPFLVKSNLGIRQWLTQAWPAGSFLRSTRKDPRGVGVPLNPTGYTPDVLSYHIKFTLVSSVNATPTWNLVRVATTSNPLVDAGRTRTHELLITIGPGAGPPPTVRNNTLLAARAAGLSDRAANIHNSQLFGSAVNSGRGF
jgi:hypothetical protein